MPYKLNVLTGKLDYYSTAGAGDMTKAVYDTDESNIVDKSENLESSTTIDIVIGGAKVGEIDSNGNLKIKGTFIEGETF